MEDSDWDLNVYFFMFSLPPCLVGFEDCKKSFIDHDWLKSTEGYSSPDQEVPGCQNNDREAAQGAQEWHKLGWCQDHETSPAKQALIGRMSASMFIARPPCETNIRSLWVGISPGLHHTPPNPQTLIPNRSPESMKSEQSSPEW